jgi:hypothetical protein
MNQPVYSKFGYLIRSRKFWAALIVVLVIAIKAFYPAFPFTAEQITSVVVIVVAYIFGTALEDAGNALSNKP